MNAKRCSLLVCAVVGALSASCVAFHDISIETAPPGADIYVNENHIGQTPEDGTPLNYKLESPLAEKVWPWDVTIAARQLGRREDQRTYKKGSPLPQRVRLILQPLETAPPGTTPARSDDDIDEKRYAPRGSGDSSGGSFQSGPDR